MGEEERAAMDDDVEMGEDDGTEMGEGEITPQPRKPASRQYMVGHDGDDEDEDEDEDEPFKTPVALRQKNREDEWRYIKHAKSHDLEQKETVKRKRDQMGGAVDDTKKGTKGNNKVSYLRMRMRATYQLFHCSV